MYIPFGVLLFSVIKFSLMKIAKLSRRNVYIKINKKLTEPIKWEERGGLNLDMPQGK